MWLHIQGHSMGFLSLSLKNSSLAMVNIQNPMSTCNYIKTEPRYFGHFLILLILVVRLLFFFVFFCLVQCVLASNDVPLKG